MESSDSISRASYWQYKDDTGYVLKWIEQTAKACGWKRPHAKQAVPDPSTLTPTTAQSSTQAKVPAKETTDTKVTAGSRRLKGKERKAAKQQAATGGATAANEANLKSEDKEEEIVYSALEIMSQANLISTCLSTSPSTVTRPPPSVMKSLYRAIRLRRTFSHWFETARPYDSKSNSAHRYFIAVLEEITNIFAQSVGKIAVDPSQAGATGAAPGADHEAKQNLYEALLAQVIQEDEEDEPVKPTKSANQTTTENTTKPSRKYHIEVKDSQEIVLMVFTLFTDLHDLREEMKALWERCFKDGADMVVATLMTAQALAFVHDLEKEIISILESPKYQHGLPNQDDHQNHAWSFPGTYCRLRNVLRDPRDLQAVLAFEDSCYETEKTSMPLNMNDLTFAYSARRLSKLTAGVNGEWCKPLLLDFEYNPFALLNSDHLLGVIERDTILCRLVAEIMYLGYASPPQGPNRKRAERERRFESMRQDPILSFLHPVWTQEEVNLTGVFAAEIMLDIYDLTEKFPSARPSYEAIHNKYMKLLCLKVDTDSAGQTIVKQTPGSSFLLGLKAPGWDSKVKDGMDKALCMLPVPNTQAIELSSEQLKHRGPEYNGDAWNIYQELNEPRLPIKYRTDFYQWSGLFNMVWLMKDLHYFFNHYTMFCTHREAFMQTLIESIGIDILNHVDRYGLGAMAHIYNASRQMGLGNLQWPAMDRLIELHRVALFAGDPPTTAADILVRFSHRYWGPKRPMSHNAKIKIMNRPATLMKPSAMTQAFNVHWETCGRTPFWHTLKENVLAAAVEKTATRKRATSKASPVTKQRFVEHMPAMEEYLTMQLRDVRVDYHEIDRVNAAFKRKLHEHARGVFEKLPNKILPKEELDEWSDIDFVSEAFEQEAEFHELRIKAGGDPSKLPVQDCDYLLDSINCLADTLRSMGIGHGQDTAGGGAGVNMPVSVTRFRIRGSEDLPDLSRLLLVHPCTCCHRKHHV